MAEEGTQELMTVAEVAAIRRCSVETVRRRIKTGAIPAVREGGRVLIRRVDALEGAKHPTYPKPEEARAHIAQILRRSERAMADPQLRELAQRLEAGQYNPFAHHPNA